MTKQQRNSVTEIIHNAGIPSGFYPYTLLAYLAPAEKLRGNKIMKNWGQNLNITARLIMQR